MAKSSAKRATSPAKTSAKRTTAKKMPETKPTTAPRVGQPRYSESAKITVLPKGKDNPRREGLGPYKRYAVLLKSKTVGEFLKELPEWRSTINRAVKEERIEVKE
jgi:hypothetical protein